MRQSLHSVPAQYPLSGSPWQSHCPTALQTPFPLHELAEPPGHTFAHVGPQKPLKQSQMPIAVQFPLSLHGETVPPGHSNWHALPKYPRRQTHCPSSPHSPLPEHGKLTPDVIVAGHVTLQDAPPCPKLHWHRPVSFAHHPLPEHAFFGSVAVAPGHRFVHVALPQYPTGHEFAGRHASSETLQAMPHSAYTVSGGFGRHPVQIPL